jgi:glutamine amidotransferase
LCRFAAYIGPPRPLSTLLYEPPRSLEVLAYAPREMLNATVNVDGTGVVWWEAGDDRPLRYVTTSTPWADVNLPHLAPRITGRIQLGAVRAATPGIPFSPGNVAPFVFEGLAFSHNGWLGGYRKGVGRTLLGRLPDDLYAAIDTVSDSVTVFATLVKHLRDGARGDLATALRLTVAEATQVVTDAGESATLNLLVSDGRCVLGVRASAGYARNSLYTLRDQGRWGEGAVVASEPLDPDLDWTPVPEDHLLVLTGADTTLEPLA